MYDVLDEALISVNLGGETRHGTLPQVFAWLSGDREVMFAALQPHQHHPWHAFLVQLAAIAWARGRCQGFSIDPEVWRSLLLGLTGGQHEPWCLVAENLAMPALLQPPVPEGELGGFKTLLTTPDALDILLTTRNFDLKAQRMVHPLPEHWLFALVTKQTFEGYSGKMNYGIARMNGGQANRPCIAVAPSRSWGPRFRRDVKVWLERREALVAEYAYDPNGHALLWLLPWDGTASLARPTLDPFFIEICRRIRLVRVDDRLAARMTTSQIARIDTTDYAGDTGDIWTPTQKSPKKNGDASLTVPASGFHYKKIVELLFGDGWKLCAAQQLREDDSPEPIVIAQALVRGQGKTEGYHERVLFIPAKARGLLGRSRSGPESILGQRSKGMIGHAGEARSLLRTTILTLFQGVRNSKLDLRDPKADPWLDRFEARVDDCFFTELFENVEQGDTAARLAWANVLDVLTTRIVDEAIREAPLPSSQRFAIVAGAQGRFSGGRRRVFAELIEHRRATARTDPENPASDQPVLPAGA